MDLYRSGMTKAREYNLNTKPLTIDVLIPKGKNAKNGDSEIGKIFRQYNILEYKSPNDRMNIDTCYKVNGYACLFKSYGEKVNCIKAKDVTISLFRHTKPKKLFDCFRKEGIGVTKPYPGIYYIDNMPFAMQIVVIRELDFDKHMWLVALSGRLPKEQVRKILKRASELTDPQEKELVDSVMQVCLAANRKTVEELKREEDDRMCQALLEIMEPELT